MSNVRPALTKLVRPCISRRLSLFGSGSKKGKEKAIEEPIIGPDALFHAMSLSPIPTMRERAARIKKQAVSPLWKKKVDFDCKHSGWPTHHNEQEWTEDAAEHARYWPTLRQTNEDEHDLRSGRHIQEFDQLPDAQPFEEAVSMANWDVFLYTRGFQSMDTDRSLRHISKLLTYPITIGTVLHENSPYSLKNQRLTREGLRSLIALRQSLHPPLGGSRKQAELTTPLQPMRIFCLGARAESSLPGNIWSQLNHLFPNIPLHIYFIGPEVIFPSPSNRPVEKSSATGLRVAEQFGVPGITNIVNPWLTLTSLKSPYENVHEALGPFDPYRDVYFAFSPGFGFASAPTNAVTEEAVPQSQTNWREALLQILETKCGLFATGFSLADVERDVVALDQTEGVAGEFEWVLTPGDNPFASLKVEVADFDYRVMFQTNWGIWAIKGKRYEVEPADSALYNEEGLVATKSK